MKILKTNTCANTTHGKYRKYNTENRKYKYRTVNHTTIGYLFIGTNYIKSGKSCISLKMRDVTLNSLHCNTKYTSSFSNYLTFFLSQRNTCFLFNSQDVETPFSLTDGTETLTVSDSESNH